MRILYLAGRELTYPRNDVLRRAFERFAQVDVIGSPQRPASLLRGSLRLALRAAPRLASRAYDLVFVGFYGHLLMLPAGLLARRPVLFDAFVSTYDTLVDDRQTLRPTSLAGRLAFGLDQASGRLADHILLDTPQHCAYYAQTFGLPLERFSALPVGCNEDLFHPQPPGPPHSGPLRVLYYTSYMPLHGVDVVVQAAHRLRSQGLHFRLIGSGPTRAAVQRQAQDLGLENVEFLADVPLTRLPGELAQADICLGGHFGGSLKAGRVVPGKVYQALAMGCPLIATTTPANLDLLAHGQSAYLCQPQDPEALADGLLRLARDPALRQRLAAGARACYLETCSEAVITARLQEVVSRAGCVRHAWI